VLQATARTSFSAFVYLAFSVLHPGRRLDPSWHIDTICWHVQKMSEGKAPPRCVINLQPRSLKSFTLSVCLPAWLLGKNPSAKIICISYSGELAAKLSRDCRALTTSDFFRRLFPETRLNPQKSTESEFETTKRGYRLATSVGGTLTGRGGEWLILDDPVKAEEGASPTARASVNEWFKVSAISRLDNQLQDKIIVTQQRLHEEDLSGLLIRSGWHSLSVRAIATEDRTFEIGPDKFYTMKTGDILQPDRMNQETLDGLRELIGQHDFEAMYQQNPLPDDGVHLLRDYFKPSDGLDPNVWCCRVLSVDPAAKKGAQHDFTAITIWDASRKGYHLVHATKGRWNIIESVAHIAKLIGEFHVKCVIVEDTSSGTGVLDLLKAEFKTVEFSGTSPTQDKYRRLLKVSGKIESGKVTIARDAAWANEFLDEVVNFPRPRHDDYVDSLIQFLEWTGAEGELLFGEPVMPWVAMKDS